MYRQDQTPQACGQATSLKIPADQQSSPQRCMASSVKASTAQVGRQTVVHRRGDNGERRHRLSTAPDGPTASTIPLVSSDPGDLGPPHAPGVGNTPEPADMSATDDTHARQPSSAILGYARIDPLSTRFVGYSASFPSLRGSRMAAGLWLAVAARLRAFAREVRRGRGGPAATNTKATQVRVQEKINTPVTRTRRHSPAHGGTIARMSV
jgi:hypothetical protein